MSIVISVPKLIVCDCGYFSLYLQNNVLSKFSSTSEHNGRVKEMIKENILHQPNCKYSEDTVMGTYIYLLQ